MAESKMVKGHELSRDKRLKGRSRAQGHGRVRARRYEYSIEPGDPRGTNYNLFAFDWACDGFLVGALMTIAETTPLPTAPREVAFMGLIAYLTEIRGLRFERARERAALLYNAPEGSKAALLFEAGQHHWKNPDALKIYFRTQQPGEAESQKWTDAMQRQKRYIVCGGIAALIAIAIVTAFIMHM